MKMYAPAALALCLTLAACTTTTTSSSTTYDANGQPVRVETSSTTTNDTVESMKKAGGAVKDGVVSGYEWTKEKTVKGYEWVKEKVTEEPAKAEK